MTRTSRRWASFCRLVMTATSLTRLAAVSGELNLTDEELSAFREFWAGASLD
jgi:hypothetical protein